ncbi:MAG: SHOCT domain-containing protein [Sedimenticolaceae bacterium]
MSMSKRFAVFVIAGVIVVCGAEVGERFAIPGVHSLIPSAEARVGRPLTPVSVAGVARRTARRAVVYGGAATTAVVATQPSTVVVQQPVQSSDSSTEQKMQELQNMYDKGLITEDEYEQKKQALLNNM